MSRPAASDERSGSAPPEPLTRRQFVWTFVGLLLAMLLAALDQTIVATALPTIVGELKGLEHLSWVITAYMLAATIGLPLYGKAGDLFGRKPVLIFAIAVFLIGSALSGAAHTMTQLISFRALQGVGGGGLMIGVQAVVADIVSPRDRGRYMGVLGGVFGVSSIAGPLVGGFFTDHLTWRWVFYVNLPLGLIALATVVFALHVPRRPRARAPLDLPGIVLLAMVSTALVLLSAWGGTTYDWGSPTIMGLGAGAVVAAVLFVLAERRAAEPILPLSLFRERNFVAPALAGIAVGVSMFSAVAYLPTLLQMIDGVDATRSGLMMIPMTFGILTTSVLTGRLISATGRYRAYPIIGAAVAAGGLLLLSRIGATSPYWYIAVSMFVLGLGVGCSMQNIVLIVQNSVPYPVMGAAISGANYFRQVGASLGIALFGSLFVARLKSELAGSAPAGMPAPGGVGDLRSLTPQALANLPAPVRTVIVDAFAKALPVIFLYGIPIALAGLLAALFIQARPLGTQPGHATAE